MSADAELKVALDLERASNAIDSLNVDLIDANRNAEAHIGTALDIHPAAVRFMCRSMTGLINNTGGDRALLGLQVGMMLGARLARATEDSEHFNR